MNLYTLQQHTGVSEMYMHLDKTVIDMLCCPFCKSELHQSEGTFTCKVCGLSFPGKKITVGKGKEETVFDFRIHTPQYCIPENLRLWQHGQNEFENFDRTETEHGNIQVYLDEIDSVKEIYTNEFHLSGKVLDVGGHQGRLRHFLDNDVDLYVSIDPFINIFEGIDEHSTLLKAYPRLQEPCNFISAHAEYLPFKSGSFDWIHMRSVVDHFENPYFAFLEAFRCCRPRGKMLVGLAIEEKIPQSLSHLSKFKQLSFQARSLVSGFFHLDHHMNRLTVSQLHDLYRNTGWTVVKEHWQKPPFNYCIYSCTEARRITR
jgi:ubiquinone/menaquinone biosynthesis C-methylase UbiE